MSGYTGEIRIFAFGFVPSDFMICDGSALDKQVYRNLYQVVGDVYANSNTTREKFSIPDLRDRFVKQSGTDIKLGEMKGSDELVLSKDQMPEHDHNVQLEVDNGNGGDESVIKPKNAFLNNNARNFSREASKDVFLGGINQNVVGESRPVSIKNSQTQMVFAIYIGADFINEGFIGEIKIWPNDKTGSGNGSIPSGWKICDGATYAIGANSPLGSIIGFLYGEEDGKPKLPDLRNRIAAGAEDTSKMAEVGGKTHIRIAKNQLAPHTHGVGLAVNNDSASENSQIPNHTFINHEAGKFSSEITAKALLGGLSQENRGGWADVDITNSCIGLTYIICTDGVFSPHTENSFIGEVKLYAGAQFKDDMRNSFAICRGQNIAITQNQSLYSLIMNHYGGNNQTFFTLPDLRKRAPTCLRNLDAIGKTSGENEIRLIAENLPPHDHHVRLAASSSGQGHLVSIPNGILNKDAGPFSTKNSENAFLGGIAEEEFGGEPIDIRNPFLAIHYLICLNGIYPSKS